MNTLVCFWRGGMCSDGVWRWVGTTIVENKKHPKGALKREPLSLPKVIGSASQPPGQQLLETQERKEPACHQANGLSEKQGD